MTTADTYNEAAARPPTDPTGHDAPATPALSIRNVSHSYGARRALMDVAFDVPPASFTALLGLNGAGKSTLFSLVTRLFGIQTGHISIFGHDNFARIAKHLPNYGYRDEGVFGIVLDQEDPDAKLRRRLFVRFHIHTASHPALYINRGGSNVSQRRNAAETLRVTIFDTIAVPSRGYYSPLLAEGAFILTCRAGIVRDGYTGGNR